ncbi:hypothetical protein EDD17DRAFT_1750996 [Pisolithus thermaeus]|nr:hypothetical protein EDD17DRAFT_1750996 [Pisolithus thermaeus]
MSDWKQAYSEILSSYVGMYKEAKGNLELRNEILAEVKGKILEHEPLHSVELPQNLRVAIQMEWLSQLDPEDWQDEIAIIQHILTLAFTGKNKEDAGEGENAREEKARPTKAGDYKKPFTAFTAAQQVFKEEMDSYDRERRDTKDPKTIGKRTRIVQQWWESLLMTGKQKLGEQQKSGTDLVLSWQINRYCRKNLPAMAKDFIEIVQRTMGSHVVMFVGHESGEGQIKLAFETVPGGGKKVFTESSQSRKDWVLTAENILTDYLLTEPVEEDSAEKQEVEISLDEDGNPELPTWGGQKLKVQQNLARAVFQAAYAKFTKKPKAKVPWGLLIKSPMKYLDPESIPEGFTMKDPSKWTKADLRLLWDQWQSLEAQDKVIVSFIDCKKEDAPLCRQFDRKVVGSSKKRVWVTVDDDSEAEVGGAGIPGPSVTQHSVGGPSEQTVDGGEVLGEATTHVGQLNPEESSPAQHASKDCISYLKSLSIMPRYQVLVDLVDALPEQPQPNTLCVAVMETIKPFKGDKDEVQDPQMFLCMFNHVMRLAGVTDEGDKIEALQDYIVPQSEAQRWYDNLTGSQRTSWSKLMKAFNEQWEALPQVEKTPEKYQEELMALRLEDSEVRSTKEINGTKAWMHIMWAKEALHLAKAAGVESNMGLVRIVHKNLPKIIWRLMTQKYTSFEDLTKAIKNLDIDDMLREKEDADEQKREEKEREKLILQQQQTSLADLATHLQ